MKAIIVHRHLVELIDRLKNVEFRQYGTDYRGPLLLCAPETRTHHCRCVCLVDLAACTSVDGVFSWRYENPREALPVRVEGTSGLFDVPLEVDELVLLDSFGVDWKRPVDEALERLKKTKKIRR